MAAQKQISASSLQPDHSGWMTKVGGGIKTWKSRWFILQGKNLYYFKGKKDAQLTGVIELSAGCSVQKANKKKEKKFCFGVNTPQRNYLMYPDTEKEMEEWMSKISSAINGKSSMSTTTSQPVRQPEPTRVEQESQPAGAGFGSDNNVKESRPSQGGPRGKLDQGKDAIPWLHSEDSKVLEFWQIWSESIPPSEEIMEGGVIVYEVSTSADMEKLSWRASGPQNIFIQKMVDFFWNVGAPESEIDRLNDVGALVNPNIIGSWIDMSAKGGMDGGWFFPVDVDIKTALEASDQGEPLSILADWIEQNGVQRSLFVGRDMGAAPPRQTEIRFLVPGGTYEVQLERALDAYTTFGIPEIPEDVVAIIRENGNAGICMSVITSSEGFVRLGMMVPFPEKQVVQTLCSLGGTANPTQLMEFQDRLGVGGPEWVEFQHLMQGFGYGVYKEGFDVVFHFKVGEEGPR